MGNVSGELLKCIKRNYKNSNDEAREATIISLTSAKSTAFSTFSVYQICLSLILRTTPSEFFDPRRTAARICVFTF